MKIPSQTRILPRVEAGYGWREWKLGFAILEALREHQITYTTPLRFVDGSY
jgi:hypothetical protein